ncbi:ankyrin repeat and fibronectin type-III domain-containing protein 1-like isoform X2 [Rhopilema esculentum]
MRSFFRNNTIPRSLKAAETDPGSKPLTISPGGAAWTLEDDVPVVELSTVEGTPFSQTSNQLYYKTRPTISKANQGFLLDINEQRMQLSLSFKEDSSKISSEDLSNEDPELCPYLPSLRRRANSLDHIPSPSTSPSAFRKKFHYSPVESPRPSFNRTISLSQRSPFRKRNAFTEPEATLLGLKDQRPRSFKRHKNAMEALFDAIERQDTEEVRKIMQQPGIKVNGLNSDDFTPLDIALLKGDMDTAKLLLHFGAIENPSFINADARAEKLESLITEADKNVNDFTASIVNCTADIKESERQLREWEWRLYTLRLMHNTLVNTDAPNEIPVVSAAPLSDQSVIIIITPAKHSKKELITKYKIEWSSDLDFQKIKGVKLVMDVRSLQCTIDGLEKGRKCYLRVRVGNIKGFGPPVTPDPPFVIPSSWHEINDQIPRYTGCKERLEELLEKIMAHKAALFEEQNGDLGSKNGASPVSSSKESPKLGRKGSVFRTVSKYTNLVFHSAPKLLKRLKCRGIYLATLLYNEEDDRVLVTMDDNIPVVEVDDNFSKSFTQEFYWLAKISCTWEDVQQMLLDSSKVHSSHAIHIRRKLLQASMVLQNATGVQDLGYLYHKAFKDSHGSILLLTINNAQKSFCSSKSSTMKWIPISKLQKKTNAVQDAIVPQRLIPSLQEQVMYHRRSKVSVSRGLYLGYLKLRTAVDSLSIVVPETQPNLPPHVKIRDIPNVTKEDWLWIQSIGSSFDLEAEASPSCSAFESKLKAASKKLFTNLGIEEEYASRHRIYNKEVIELNDNVLMVLLLPPVDDMCTAPGQSDLFHALSGYLSIPVQTFEMINMNTYQPNIMKTYARLSSILELETFVCLQTAREALSPSEAKVAADRQKKVTEFQKGVDAQWHNARWILDVIQMARDKHFSCGALVGHLYDPGYVCKKASLSPPSSKHINTVNRTKNGLSLKSSSCNIKVHGTEEIGVLHNEFVEIDVTMETTVKEIVHLAAQGMLQFISEPNRNFFESSAENMSFLGLVVLSGSKERCLRDDLKLLSLQNPWDRGQIFLRLKKEAYKAAKLSKSTSV